jgi:alcohol dehydrogenase class IV
MAMKSFSIATGPRLLFGVGERARLPEIIDAFGTQPLVITGARSFRSSPGAEDLWSLLSSKGYAARHFSIPHEPTPQLVDSVVTAFSSDSIDVVVAIGGGSVLDAGKAISAMLPLKVPVKDYLEGVGRLQHPGVKIPFIALPTTAGTGSEATKNAVLSEVGPAGYKKSLRHDRFVPDVALIDPQLCVSCPPSATAASGMDSFTQLLESYLSCNANPITDALAFEGLSLISQALIRAYRDGKDIEARNQLSLAAYISGLTLTSAGLGLVHGFASSIGGYFDIPHGIICSALIPSVNQLTVQKLRKHDNHHAALAKYANVGKIFCEGSDRSTDYYIDALLEMMTKWSLILQIPKLSSFAITPFDYNRIITATENKYNPIDLDPEEMMKALDGAC